MASTAQNRSIVKTGSQQRSSSSQSETGSNLDKLVSFIQENWKSILTDLVGAGVTAYLEHNSKEKARSEARTATRQ